MPPPSERTIETLSNHALLEILNFGVAAPAPFAWIYVPSQWDEQTLGYDAELQGRKRLFIQYKARSDFGSFKFDFRQLWVLCRRYPRHTTPYVFLSGNELPDYVSIAMSHTPPGGTRYLAFNRTFFVDAWALLEKLIHVVTAGLFVLPNVLPLVSPFPCKGDITLSPSAGMLTGKIRVGTYLEASLQSACSVLGFGGPFANGPLKLAYSGNGVTFADEIAACHFGRPLGLPLERDDGRVQVSDEACNLSILTMTMLR